MTWQHLTLAVWAFGALGAFPANYEHAQSLDATDEDPEPLPWWVTILVAAAGAVLWPASWLSLVAYAAKRTVFR